MSDATERAREWRNALHAAVCDVIEPWEHGTVVLATRFPSYWSFNLVRVEDDPALDAAKLMEFADQALAGLEHRRFDFDVAAVVAAVRPDFEAAGWEVSPLVWMRHEEPLPQVAHLDVEVVPYDAVIGLRRAWHFDESDHDPTEYLANAREVAQRRDVQVLAVLDGESPVAFAQLEREGDAAEITQVYVHPDYRGGGRGTAMTAAAIEAASDVRDLWIVADAEGRPRELYARLGFRPVWESAEVTRLPGATPT